MTTTQEALEMIEAAFTDVPRPSNEELLHPDSADDMDLVPLYDVASWKDMTDEDVIGTYAAPSFLSAAGFRHFIPAYMSFTLRHPDSPEAVVDSTVWTLCPDMYAEDLRRFVASKYELLDGPQRAAVIAFLEAMPHDDAPRALEYWQAHSCGRFRALGPQRADGRRWF